ncbi:MAG: peptidoglycan-associated lipoprotein Pal [Nitrospinae bacterium]|nr:peptidoglycan-associated lipoprotein Pal [Nitrospinota bacterium]
MKSKTLLAAVFVSAFAVISTGCASKKADKADAAAPVSEKKTEGKADGKTEDKKNQEAVQQVQPNVEEVSRQERIDAEKVKEEEARKAAESTPAAVVGKLESIHFDFDKSDIKSDDGKILAKNAEVLKAHPSVNVVIEGHCDERGTAEYNLALGERRASSAKKYLVSLGVEETKLGTISYGEEKPLDEGHNETAWAKNRRAQFAEK